MGAWQHRRDRSAEDLAAGCWLAAALLYVTIERVAAFAFSPPYSYAHDYISDLGVPVCGTRFDGRAICSPLHWLMNANFGLQGLLFVVAAVAIIRSISHATRFSFLGFAVCNGIGNGLVAFFPETAPGPSNGIVNYHVLGAFLAIVFGNAAVLASAWTFRELGLGRIHHRFSVALPLLAGSALAMLVVARGSGTANVLPDGVWERTSVYTITAWEALTAICLLWGTRRR